MPLILRILCLGLVFYSEILFIYASMVEPIHNIDCKTKAILANRSRMSHVGHETRIHILVLSTLLNDILAKALLTRL